MSNFYSSSSNTFGNTSNTNTTNLALTTDPSLESTLEGLPSAEGTFGIVVAGRPVNLDIRQADENKFLAEIPLPSEGSGEIVVFLLPDAPELPNDQGIVIYWSIPPFEDWRLLGTLTNNNPSAVFRTDWPSDPEIQNVPFIQLGISIEDIDTVQNLTKAVVQEKWDRLAFAELVARDLFTYIQSFSQVTDRGEQLIIPTDALDKWINRFETRYKKDPNFLVQRAANSESSAV